MASRPRAFRLLQIGTCAAAAILFVGEAGTIPFDRGLELLLFTLLAALAFRLRVRYAGNFVGFEAAAAHVPICSRRKARGREAMN